MPVVTSKEAPHTTSDARNLSEQLKQTRLNSYKMFYSHTPKLMKFTINPQLVLLNATEHSF
jgi:hypothetical protein